MTLATGKRLGRYEIRSKIGEGGMGEVYLAQDAKLDRTVAIKVLPSDLASNPNRMRRFVQEARTASSLSHPNVAHVYEIEEIDGLNFIAMEQVAGENYLGLGIADAVIRRISQPGELIVRPTNWELFIITSGWKT